MRKVQLTETVLRDANQSLMATRLTYAAYEDILPVPKYNMMLAPGR